MSRGRGLASNYTRNWSEAVALLKVVRLAVLRLRGGIRHTYLQTSRHEADCVGIEATRMIGLLETRSTVHEDCRPDYGEQEGWQAPLG